MRFMACPHAARLDLAWLRGEDEDLVPVDDSEDTVLLRQHGDRHEIAHLEHLEAEGKDVTRIETEGASFGESLKATRDALTAGPDIIFQGALDSGMWGGYADFLERVPVPSDLGAFSYEVADTKLKRKPAPGHVLQLALYSDMLAAVQGHAPEKAHIQLGTGERVSFRLSEYSEYARFARDRLEDFVRNPPPTRPVPCSLCDLCRWRDHCGECMAGGRQPLPDRRYYEESGWQARSGGCRHHGRACRTRGTGWAGSPILRWRSCGPRRGCNTPERRERRPLHCGSVFRGKGSI